MHTIFVAILLVEANYAYLTCKIACKSCSGKNYVPELLEVYCDMCKECKMRRREQMKHNLDRNKADNQKHDEDTASMKDSRRFEGARKQFEEKKPNEDDEALQYDVQTSKHENEEVAVNHKSTTPNQNTVSQENKVSTCPTSSTCADDEEEIRPECILFGPPPVPIPFPYPPLYCLGYAPCVYQYPVFSHTTTTCPTESTTTTETTTTTTITTTTETSMPVKHSRIKKVLKPYKPVAAPPCFTPYNPCPNYLSPVPMGPVPMLQPPTYIPAFHYFSNVPEQNRV